MGICVSFLLEYSQFILDFIFMVYGLFLKLLGRGFVSGVGFGALPASSSTITSPDLGGVGQISIFIV